MNIGIILKLIGASLGKLKCSTEFCLMGKHQSLNGMRRTMFIFKPSLFPHFCIVVHSSFCLTILSFVMCLCGDRVQRVTENHAHWRGKQSVPAHISKMPVKMCKMFCISCMFFFFLYVTSTRHLAIRDYTIFHLNTVLVSSTRHAGRDPAYI